MLPGKKTKNTLACVFTVANVLGTSAVAMQVSLAGGGGLTEFQGGGEDKPQYL